MRSIITKHLFSLGLLVALVCVSASLWAQERGSFTGTVLLDNRDPLPGASVYYHNSPRSVCEPDFGCHFTEPFVNGTVTSGPDGRFTVADVPIGGYQLCATGTQPNHLRSCIWGELETGAFAPDNQGRPLTVNIRTGSLVTFRVNDPAGVIKIQDLTGTNASQTNLIINIAWRRPNGVGNFFRALYVSTSGSQWTYQVPVLTGVPLQLFFSTIAPMKILDQTGQPLPLSTSTGSLQATDTSGITVNLSVQPSGQTLTGAVTNGATFQPGVAPGSIATVFDQGITNVTGIFDAKSLPLPTEINGTSVSINGARVPLYGVARVNGQEQVNFQMPSNYAAPGMSVVVNNNGVDRPAISSNVFPAMPGIFTVGGRQVAIQHGSDFRLVTSTDPAIRGEPVVIYATGLGPVDPDPGPGNPAAASPLSLTRYLVLATVGGKPAPVLFSGLAPGFVGLNQVNIQVPPDSPFGDVDVVLSVVIENISFSSLPAKLSVQ
ncbi:MAG: hypothetical protein HY649_02295 [Acidobacteria bacterium]|nr:hypothetical protein [Acidobacteriota bacterium]